MSLSSTCSTAAVQRIAACCCCGTEQKGHTHNNTERAKINYTQCSELTRVCFSGEYYCPVRSCAVSEWNEDFTEQQWCPEAPNGFGWAVHQCSSWGRSGSLFLLRADGKHLCLKSLLIPKLPSYQEGLAVSKYCDISKVNVMGEALNLDKRDCFETK